MKLIRCDASGVNDDRTSLIYRMTGDDGHDYDYEVTHSAFLETFATCWTRGQSLTGGVAVAFVPLEPASAKIGDSGSGPALWIQNGPMALMVPLSRSELTELAAEAAKRLATGT